MAFSTFKWAGSCHRCHFHPHKWTLTALGKGLQSAPVQVLMLLQGRMLQTVHASVSFWCSTLSLETISYLDYLWYLPSLGISLRICYAFFSGQLFIVAVVTPTSSLKKYPLKPMSTLHPGLFLVLSFSSSLNSGVSWVLKPSLPRCVARIFSLQATLSLSC